MVTLCYAAQRGICITVVPADHALLEALDMDDVRCYTYIKMAIVSCTRSPYLAAF